MWKFQLSTQRNNSGWTTEFDKKKKKKESNHITNASSNLAERGEGKGAALTNFGNKWNP